MNTWTDQQLLREYAERHSEAAFSELVRRHVDLVHSAAKRMTGDAHSAEDVTQAVFMALAQNAARLSRHPVLSGWLHTTARNLAVKTVRATVRRQLREQEAAAMNPYSSTENEPLWDDIAPHLDTALGELNDDERDALMLRYFEKKSAPEIAALIGISDAAAQKRVTRAVERLRQLFARRGVTAGAGGLAVIIGAHAVEAAPITLAANISTTALAGAAAPASTVITATKAIAMTTLQKTLVTATIAILAGAGIYEVRQASLLRQQNQALEQRPAADQLPHSQTTPDESSNGLASLRQENEQLKSNQTELLKLRGAVGTLRSEASDADQRAKAAEQKLSDTLSSASVFKGDEAATINAEKQISMALRIFAETNNNQFPTPQQFLQFQRELRESGSSNIGGEGVGPFEYVNPGTEWRDHPNTVVLRERLAKQAVDGTWERIYAFADGSVQTALSHDGNFEAWEKVNTYTPPQ
ncbi:MAG TPA: sigma-70 family RNA polymerase sigma factor [Verrucomicrobiae bacterium]|nr:sigma-70 family RNA polymerase sigma factor [Verrucomicrobiae bacterium]